DAVVITEDLKPVSQNVNGINMMIDPRMELLSVVQATGTYDEQYDLITNVDFDYKKDIMKYFSDFSNHDAVKVFNNMSRSGFSFDAPPTAMLYLSNPLNLKTNQDFSDYLKNRAGEEELNKFTLELRNFAMDTRFHEFFNKHRKFYDSVIEENAKILGNTNYIDNLEQYYGMKQNSYNIILSPMFHNGGFGPRVENENGKYDVYSIQGTSSVKNNIPIFGNESGFRYVALHEFSHSFINPLTEENISEVNKYSRLFNPISEKMSKQAYTSWDICVNEHIVRAVVSRITFIHQGKEAYDKLITYEKEIGFLYIDALTKQLEEFENNRDKYKTFEDFYPELLKGFKDLSSATP
ncbi:DUF4932 domain-containing protein, partial [Clostridium sp.]|uniref:DUF4932 domain-containing protein n=1 Tax=Clostridium sp. TaxID=1506 RepID=UPI002FCA52D8